MLEFSNSAAATLGYSKKELEDFTIFDIDPEITKDWWKTHFTQIKQKGSIQIEWLVKRKAEQNSLLIFWLII